MNIKTDYNDVKFKDNGKLKLLIIVGTRPEIIRLAAGDYPAFGGDNKVPGVFRLPACAHGAELRL